MFVWHVSGILLYLDMCRHIGLHICCMILYKSSYQTLCNVSKQLWNAFEEINIHYFLVIFPISCRLFGFRNLLQMYWKYKNWLSLIEDIIHYMFLLFNENYIHCFKYIIINNSYFKLMFIKIKIIDSAKYFIHNNV